MAGFQPKAPHYYTGLHSAAIGQLVDLLGRAKALMPSSGSYISSPVPDEFKQLACVLTGLIQAAETEFQADSGSKPDVRLDITTLYAQVDSLQLQLLELRRECAAAARLVDGWEGSRESKEFLALKRLAMALESGGVNG